MRLKIGAPRVIVRGGKCEDTPWGFYQFPKLFAGEDGVYACVHVEDDSPDCYGMPEKWFVSRDGGGALDGNRRIRAFPLRHETQKRGVSPRRAARRYRRYR